jgi:hypothetical protein
MPMEDEPDPSEYYRRFDVELFIVHPTVDPSEITKELGLEAPFSRRVGDRRKTPKGTLLSGNYPDTRWRHSVRHEAPGQWFAEKVKTFVDQLEPHKGFLANLSATGGRATIVIQFLGDNYFGDQIPQATLAKIVDLGLSLGIEVYSVPQGGQTSGELR